MYCIPGVFPAERMRLEYQPAHLKVFNNTVINYYGRNLNFNHKKRGAVPLFEIGLSIDCLASQGDHLPFWFTTNIMLGGDDGIIQEEGQNGSYGQEILSNYVARLSFQDNDYYEYYDYYYEYFSDGQFEGTYQCVSAKSGLSQEFYFTTGTYIFCIGALHVQIYTLILSPGKTLR